MFESLATALAMELAKFAVDTYTNKTEATQSKTIRGLAKRSALAAPSDGGGPPEAPPKEIAEHYIRISRDLINQALSKGLGDDADPVIRRKAADAGSTADMVILADSEIGCVVKYSDDPKIVSEARVIESIQTNPNLSKEFQDRFPKIYAIRDTDLPYAYLMQKFSDEYVGFEKIVFDQTANGQSFVRISDVIMDTLLGAYQATIDRNIKPSMHTIYLGRIEERLNKAAQQDPRFKTFMEKGLVINGETFEKPQAYIDIVSDKLHVIEPQFTTFVHGDPNPENILVKTSATGVDVKFIDTKEWYSGDYIFDIAKVCHYLEATGPAELTSPSPVPEISTNGTPNISYTLDLSPDVNSTVANILSRTQAFAVQSHIDDKEWRKRYALSMASNLLGLPPGRLSSGREHSAFILFCEGMRYLKECAEMIDEPR